MKPQYWQISYDISAPKRLRKIAKLANEHGVRIQKSLYNCSLSREENRRLHQQFDAIVTDEDRLMMRPVCRHCHESTRTHGKQTTEAEQQPFWII